MEVVPTPDIWGRVKEDWECRNVAWLFVLVLILVELKLVVVVIVFIVVVVDDLGLVFAFVAPLSDARFRVVSVGGRLGSLLIVRSAPSGSGGKP